MKILLLFFGLFVFIYACHNNSSNLNNSNNQTTETNYYDSIKPKTVTDKNLFYAIIDSALTYGDAKAYNSVATHQITYNVRGREFFYYAFIMANKHNNAEAYYHLYYILLTSSHHQNAEESLKSMDTKTKNFALYYLLKAYELGYKDAKDRLDKYFGKNKPIPKSSHYLIELAKE
jgi:hypothetical protein